MRHDTVHIGVGTLLNIKGNTFCVRNWQSADSVIARDIQTGEELTLSLGEISDQLGASQTAPQLELSIIDDEDWNWAFETYQALVSLLDEPSRSRSDVSRVADELSVSTATVYRWLNKLAFFGTVTCLLRAPRNDKGRKKLNLDVEKLIAEVIESEFLTKLKRSPTITHREVERRCRLKSLPVPSLSAVKNRIEEIHPEEKARRRHGRNSALAFRAIRGSFPGAEYVNAVWQIDHTLVDITLVDEKDRIPIGRPWITLIIDVYPRTVPGWYISFDPPGTLGTGIAISNAILPKEEFLAKLDLSYTWPCQGKPRTIHADNAKEFRGNTLKKACNEHGIDLKFRKVKKPNYGAHIERLLGTLLGEIHALEGTTFSNPEDKEEYDAEENAQMTLDEFDAWLANLILGTYHNRRHSGINTTPLIRHEKGILGMDGTLGPGLLPISADPVKLKIDFLPLILRTIQPSGVTIDHIEYHDSVLDKWIGARDLNNKKLPRQFIFRRDPRNISFIWFWDPDIQHYYKIAYRNIHHPAISLWELRAIKRYLNERTKEEIDENLIFHAYNEMRRIEEESKRLTMKQRRDQERRRRHQRATSPQVDNSLKVKSYDDIVGNSQTNIELELDLKDIEPFDEVEPTTGNN